MKALLRLFNAVLVDEKKKHRLTKLVTKRMVRNGYALDPYIKPSDALLDEIESVLGLSGEKANASFHKSWKVVRDSDEEELVIQQIFHYITTYGFESLGIYSQDTVYIPAEELKLPKIKEDIPLIVVRGLTADEVLERIILLGSGVALSQTVLDDILAVVESVKFDSGFVEKIKNRELKAVLSDYYHLVPQDPTEFLRHLVSKLTNESLIIKNKVLIDKIKAANGKFLDELLVSAPPDLASIFFRYKPLFLAMKSISRNKTFFNHLRKQANKLHKPLPPDYMNGVTCAVKNNKLSLSELKKRVDGATIFRKIRLARALKYRVDDCDSIVYLVRNGKGWATDFAFPTGRTQQALDIVLKSIADSIRPNVDGKTIYIPSNVHYSIPATEKQFMGNFPLGSYVSVPQDLIVGIHWTDTERRIDLDLSIVGESGKVGWDAGYRTSDLSILFSGDVTSAPLPNGASELFYIKKDISEPKILLANYYNFDAKDPVDCKLFVANEKPKELKQNYTVNPNSIVAQANFVVSKKQNILGLVASVGGENRVYFANVSIGNSITSYNSEQSGKTRKYLVHSLVNGLELSDVLVMAGAKVVSDKPKGSYIDLSPTVVDKTTIVGLLSG
jgi:hypothetical protein